MSANAACAAKMLHYKVGFYVEIYWSKLIHVGFTKVMLAVRNPSNIHRRQYGEECVIDGMKRINHNVDG